MSGVDQSKAKYTFLPQDWSSRTLALSAAIDPLRPRNFDDFCLATELISACRRMDGQWLNVGWLPRVEGFPPRIHISDPKSQPSALENVFLHESPAAEHSGVASPCPRKSSRCLKIGAFRMHEGWGFSRPARLPYVRVNADASYPRPRVRASKNSVPFEPHAGASTVRWTSCTSPTGHVRGGRSHWLDVCLPPHVMLRLFWGRGSVCFGRPARDQTVRDPLIDDLRHEKGQ